jgi:capsular polysaccharide biosynthesis protein
MLNGDRLGRPTRRLYITRRLAGRRHVLNEAELEPILADYGFEIIEAETLSFHDQVRLFSQAEAVAGPHGAGFTNLVFAPPGCRVLEMFAPTCFRWMYYHLASVMRQEYWYLAGNRAAPASPLHQDSGFDNLYVSPGDFERSLRDMLLRRPAKAAGSES